MENDRQNDLTPDQQPDNPTTETIPTTDPVIEPAAENPTTYTQEMPPEAQMPLPTSSDLATPNYVNPEPKPNFLVQNYFMLASLAVYAVDAVLFILAMTSNSYEFVNSLASIAFYVGLLGAALLGAGLTQVVMESMNSQTHKGGGLNGISIGGIVLLIASLLFGVLTLIPGIILIIVGSKRPPRDSSKPLSPIKKYLVLTGVFIGGGTAGLVIAFIIAFIISDRACQLSSSKCY